MGETFGDAADGRRSMRLSLRNASFGGQRRGVLGERFPIRFILQDGRTQHHPLTSTECGHRKKTDGERVTGAQTTSSGGSERFVLLPVSFPFGTSLRSMGHGSSRARAVSRIPSHQLSPTPSPQALECSLYAHSSSVHPYLYCILACICSQ